MPGRLKIAIHLLEQTASDWMADNAPRLGASLAYYTVFSISPLMLIVLAIAGFWYGQQRAAQRIFAEISGLIGPEGAQAVHALLQSAQKPQTGALATTIAAVTLLIGSTGVFVELQDALNTIWGVQAKSSSSWFSFIWNRVLSFAMVLVIGFLLLVSLVLSAALAALGTYLGGFAPQIHAIWQTINFLVSFGVITVLFALIFKVLPDVRIAWKDVWIGAVLTAFLFTLGKFLLGLYLGRTGVVSTYGAAGSVVVVLVWVYYSAQILFFGAEFTQVHANYSGERFAPVAYAEPIKVEDTVPAALKRRGDEPAVRTAIGPATAPHTEGQRRNGAKAPWWKPAVPIAALFAWLWFKERKRTVNIGRSRSRTASQVTNRHLQ